MTSLAPKASIPHSSHSSLRDKLAAKSGPDRLVAAKVPGGVLLPSGV